MKRTNALFVAQMTTVAAQAMPVVVSMMRIIVTTIAVVSRI